MARRFRSSGLLTMMSRSRSKMYLYSRSSMLVRRRRISSLLRYWDMAPSEGRRTQVRLRMDHHVHHGGDPVQNPLLHPVGELVGRLDPQGGIHLDVDVHVDVVLQAPGPDLMAAPDAGEVPHERRDLLRGDAGSVCQGVQVLPGDHPDRPEDEAHQ